MIIFVDIDDTICTNPNSNKTNYTNAIPHIEHIAKINKLYEQGHHIVYWTARGAVTKQDWTLLTKQQLATWGAKYHQLRLDKPYYDLFIDDKAITKIENLTECLIK